MAETAVSDEKHSKLPEREENVVLLEMMIRRLNRKGVKLIVWIRNLEMQTEAESFKIP